MILQIGESTYILYKDTVDVQIIIDIMSGIKHPSHILNLTTPTRKDKCPECGYTSTRYRTNEDIRIIHLHLLCEMRKRSLSMGWNRNLGQNSPLLVLPTDMLGMILNFCTLDTGYIWIKHLDDGTTIFFDDEDAEKIFKSQLFPKHRVIECLVKNGGHVLETLCELSDQEPEDEGEEEVAGKLTVVTSSGNV